MGMEGLQQSVRQMVCPELSMHGSTTVGMAGAQFGCTLMEGVGRQ